MRNQLKVGNIQLILVSIIIVKGFVLAQDNSQVIFPIPEREIHSQAQDVLNNSPEWTGLGLNYSVIWDELTQTPYDMYGRGVTIRGSLTKTNIANQCLAFISLLNPVMNLKAANFKLNRVLRHRNEWYASIDQYYNSIPVFKGEVRYTINSSGRIIHIKPSVYPGIDISIAPGIDVDNAVNLATSVISYNSATDTVIDASLVIFPDRTENPIAYRLAWNVRLNIQDKYALWNIFIDAQNGDLLHGFNEVAYAQITGKVEGYIYAENPGVSGKIKKPMKSEKVYNTTLGADWTDYSGYYSIGAPPFGNYTIESYLENDLLFTYAIIEPDTLHHSELATAGSPHSWKWNTLEGSTVADRLVNVYYHVTEMYLKLKDDPMFDLDLTDYFSPNDTLKLRVGSGACGGWGHIDMLTLGGPTTDCKDAAYDTDVIYHEFNHTLMRNIAGSYTNYEEGYCDFWAATNNDNSQVGEWIFGPLYTYPMRELDNDFTVDSLGGLPNNWYLKGQVWGGALWNLRGRIGQDNTEYIYIKSLFGAPYNYISLLNECLIASDLLFDEDTDYDGNVTKDTPYYDDILIAFGSKGIYPTLANLPPAKPENLTLTNSSGRPRLNWSSNAEPDLDHFNIYRKYHDSQSHYYLIGTVNSSTTTYTDNSTTIGGRWYPLASYYVTAVDDDQLGSNLSNTVFTTYLPYKQVASNTGNPQHYGVHPAYPNPLNPVTVIKYDLPALSSVKVSLFDIQGRRIRTLIAGTEAAGYKHLVWDGKNDYGSTVSSGIYILHFRANALDDERYYFQTQKIMVLK